MKSEKKTHFYYQQVSSDKLMIYGWLIFHNNQLVFTMMLIHDWCD